MDNGGAGPSLIKLGKLANARDFGKLEDLWLEALNNPGYSWRELLPIAGQVGRQGSAERADTLLETLLGWVEEHRGAAAALEAVGKAAAQLPRGKAIRPHVKRLYLARHPESPLLADLTELLLAPGADLKEAVEALDCYSRLQPGSYAVSRDHLLPGVVESLDGATGLLVLRFGERRAEFGPSTIQRLSPRPADYFPAMLLYAPDALRTLAQQDHCAFIKLALKSDREQRLNYRELKTAVTDLLGEKAWPQWWKTAKSACKRDPMIGLGAGSQPALKLLRRADKFEDRLRREFDHLTQPRQKLLKIVAYLDDLNREERDGNGEGCADAELLQHFGHGAARIATAALQDDPGLALAALAVHAEVAARGVAVPRPNPKAALQVLGRIPDAGALGTDLPEPLLQRILAYVREAAPDRWGRVWAAVLTRAGKRMCDQITKGLLEGGQQEALAQALAAAVERPTASPDLLGWLWRTRHTAGAVGQFLTGIPGLPARVVADAMFSLLDSAGKLYGMSMEEKHLKLLEAARAAIGTQNSRPLHEVIDQADRQERVRLKGLIEQNHGLSPSHRTQLLSYLRSRQADIFLEVAREWEEQGTIYTTAAGMRSTQNALRELIEVELPEVARQIGEAASHGDLSENSEYTAALEKRDQLASRAARLESELGLAKVINHEMAGSDFVNIGTRVTMLPEGAQEPETITFLGPWDADVQGRILNYQAPLAQAFMGARPGQQVVYATEGETRRWQILAVEPAPEI